jgi:hypothetical protein
MFIDPFAGGASKLHPSESFLLFSALSLQNRCMTRTASCIAYPDIGFYFFWHNMLLEEYITHAKRHTPRGARRVHVVFESFAELKLKFNSCPCQRLNIFAQLCSKSLHVHAQDFPEPFNYQAISSPARAMSARGTALTAQMAVCHGIPPRDHLHTCV